MIVKYEMQGEYLDKWLAQLRSPNARQLKRRLFARRQYEETEQQYVERVTASGEPVIGCALGQFAAANPNAAFNEYGMFFLCGHPVVSKDLRAIVMCMNDWRDCSFDEIADWLEANVERI